MRLPSIKNFLGRMLTKRMPVERNIPPAGHTPQAGSYIARDDVRVPVSDEITDELWQWLAARGWREIDLASDRRRYRAGMPAAIEELAFAESMELREKLEQYIRDNAKMSEFELARKPGAPRKVA